MMSSYNARLIYPIGYSKAPLWGNRGVRQAATDTPSQRGTRNTEQNFMGRGLIFRCWRKPECPEKTYQGRYGIRIQPLASCIGERKVYTFPLSTGLVCHPDTEQNRPYKILWSYRGLNREPTAPQARILSVCHTTPILYLTRLVEK